ncbi:hypothetical protein RIR_jg2993.t1 [Rhizophagus irregularis DAOM 181602=DAOM 197198]|nr:hypothetical protein RIR_jg2993.t1 [Rhizophagus irregularis DAOM 181602=DAOM 197198]
MHKMKNFKIKSSTRRDFALDLQIVKLWQKKFAAIIVKKTTVYRRQGDLVLEFYERQRGSCKWLIVEKICLVYNIL